MSAPDVFDELMSLRRLEVALKRGDDRMFEQGLERLAGEILAKQPFKHHTAWQTLLNAATESDRLPDRLKESLREAISRLIAVEARVAAAPEPAPTSGPDAPDAPGVALVLGWHSSLRDGARRAQFETWLARSGGRTTGAELLGRWLKDGVTLEQLVNRANLTLAAAYAGVTTEEPHWVDTLLAGLAHGLAEAPTPPLTKLVEAIAPLGAVSVLTTEPSLAWEATYGHRTFQRAPEGPGRMPLVKLAGSIDRFYCHACHGLADAPEGTARALVLACGQCGAPARPLVVPSDSPHFHPGVLREHWGWGAKILREAATWVLVAPDAPDDGAFERWLLASLDPATRVVVLSDDDAILAAWQDALDGLAGTVVTSHGSADDVLAFLLQGGVPELKTPVAAGAAPAKKKARR